MRTFLAVGVGLLAMSLWVAPPAFAAGNAEAGAKLYKANRCGICHGENGNGQGKVAKQLKLKLTNWSDKAAMSKMTDAQLTEIIEKGGKAVGKSPKMLAYGHKLKAGQVADLVAFIRSQAK